MSPDDLPMDPELEAFFVAVALEMGTRPGGSQYTPDDTLSLKDPVAKWDGALHLIRVKMFMKEHPGAPPIIAKLKRAHLEMGGGDMGMSRRTIDSGTLGEARYWNTLMETYADWIGRQKVD